MQEGIAGTFFLSLDDRAWLSCFLAGSWLVTLTDVAMILLALFCCADCSNRKFIF